MRIQPHEHLDVSVILSARRALLQQDLLDLTQRLMKARVVESYLALAVRVGEPHPCPHDTVEKLLPLALEKTCQLQRIVQVLEMHEESETTSIAPCFSSDLLRRPSTPTMACELVEQRSSV